MSRVLPPRSQLGAVLVRCAEELEGGLVELAAVIGIGDTTLRELVRKGRTPTISTCEAVAAYLEQPVGTVVEWAREVVLDAEPYRLDGGERGGRARALALGPAKRRVSAERAAAARWATR